MNITGGWTRKTGPSAHSVPKRKSDRDSLQSDFQKKKVCNDDDHYKTTSGNAEPELGTNG